MHIFSDKNDDFLDFCCIAGGCTTERCRWTADGRTDGRQTPTHKASAACCWRQRRKDIKIDLTIRDIQQLLSTTNLIALRKREETCI